MYGKIIVGYDERDRGRDALALGHALAKATGATLLVAHVFRRDVATVPGWEQHLDAVRAGAERMLVEAASPLEGIDVDIDAIGSSSPARGLQDLAESAGADLIVLGSSHRGRAGRVLMGTVADRIFHGAPCAVAIAPRGDAPELDGELRVIGVAFDASPEAKLALAEAAKLGQATSATLRVFAVAEWNIYFGYTGMAGADNHEEALGSTKEYLEREMASALEELPRSLRPSGQVLSGDAAEILASKAGEGVDLLVTGSRGYGPVRRVLLGSVSSKLARSAPCPLLVVPRSAERAATSAPGAVRADGAV